MKTPQHVWRRVIERVLRRCSSGVPRIPVAAALAVLLSSMAASRAQATTYYVSEAVGNNAFDGLSATVTGGDGPMLDVSAAIAAAPDGSPIVVASGFYADSTWDPGAKSLTLDPQDDVDICGADLCMADTIGDGIPDWWRLQYFGSPLATDSTSCASCDPVNDGFSNLEKYQCGLSPIAMYSLTAPADVISNSTGHTAFVPNFGWSSYVWSISDGTITAGQGTTNITWTAGSLGSATISVTVSNSTLCHATLTTTVDVTPIDPKLTTIHTFTSDEGGPATGFGSQGPLVQGCDDNFYDELYSGGTNGLGMIFRVTSSGTFTTVFTFSGDSNQAGPTAGFVLGSDSNFYGAAGSTAYGGGTLFRMTTAGTLTTLYSFTSSDGCDPQGLVQGPDGLYYGAADGGCVPAYFYGSVFRLNSGGTLTQLYGFSGSAPDWGNPEATMVLGTDGNFYGTTEGGGRANPGGTIFKITPSGSLSTLHTFDGPAFSGTEGPGPSDRMVEGSDGNFYGVTRGGGDTSVNQDGWGTVFRISSSGTFTSLHTFEYTEGANPFGPLIEASDGNFYGVATGGGDAICQCGTVFQITPTGGYANLYNFKGGADGSLPAGGLVQGYDGNLYGLTGSGTGGGTVFQLAVPFNPPPNQINSITLVGSTLVITIPSIAGENYQLQYSDDLTNWFDVVGALVSNSLGGTLTFSSSLSHNFYRIHITNCDGDTYTDPVESP